MLTSPSRPTPVSIPDLRAVVQGRVIEPTDADYDAARGNFYGGFDRRPAAIVRVADADDVARVVTFARDNSIELAVRSGGHSNAGHSTTDGGIVLDLRDLVTVEIDAAARTAWAGSGLTAVDFLKATTEHGLGVGFGDTGSVGLGGITTGGGVGYLVRKHGLTIDSLLGAEIVTADGRIRVVDADHEPDLFWAIRGGGGNFGVVTRFKFRLHEIGRVYGGILVLPASPDVIEGFIAESEAAPEELSTIANVMNCPPMPFVPEEYHGKIVIMAIVLYAGDAEAGERVLAPFRALATPLADMVQPISYPEIYPPEDPDYRPTAVARTMFIDRVDRDTGTTILDTLSASDASLRAVQLRVLGGAMARVPAEATAFAHRSSRIMVNVAAFYEGPDDRDARQAWVEEFAAALHQGDDGAYVNFLMNEGEERVRAAYPGATWDRLATIKHRYDPTNLFRLNQNIPPA
ncbi:MAG: FAD-binding oxidoreductase [Chloroflexota bacterium]